MLPEVAVTLKLPFDTLRTDPAAFTAATLLGVAVQFTEFVTFPELPSVYEAVAVSCWLVPIGMERDAGVICIAVMAGACTVNPTCALVELMVAVTVAVPCATVDKRPEVLTVATVAGLTVQVTWLVRFWDVPLL
jgi:hypothetical protein